MRFKEWLKLNENPYAMPLQGNLTGVFAVLKGDIIDLGFENLGLGDKDAQNLAVAYRMDGDEGGVVVPNTYMKFHALPKGYFLKPQTGLEKLELPNHWRSGVLVLSGPKDTPTWIGKRVRSPDHANSQLVKAFPWPPDPNVYQDLGDGWHLKGH